MSWLELDQVSLDYAGRSGTVRALDRVSLSLARGRILGLVGESGSGKSSLVLALMGLLPDGAHVTGRMTLDGADLIVEAPRLRGRSLAMVFQDPMTALNPVFTLESQLIDAQRARFPGLPRAELRARAAAMLRRTGIAEPDRRLASYPHELSGGLRQRVLIAMALLALPELLIADEPVTALDVTIAAQIMALFEELRDGFDGSMIFVSHSLALVLRLCDEVAVLYAGTLVETAPVAALFAAPRHPYTQALIACEADGGAGALPTIPGAVPRLAGPADSCVFAPRCPLCAERCRVEAPVLRDLVGGRRAACHFA
ncbi:MAG: peptide/nickel transport system ATP-binding protein [Aliidongia sp.]|jgi:peptide/nickel transport system ATP-binding protein|nr:peptide/nickel transport system ATP-binding protein [Aliidongia sp.]